MTRLAIVGASARAAACSAIRAGFTPVTADLFADADLARACEATRINEYPRGFARWLARQDCEAWLYTGGLENHPRLVDRMAARRPLWGVGGETLRLIRDPFELGRLFATQGLEVPRTRIRMKPGDAAQLWLSKPVARSGGLGVTVVPAKEIPLPQPDRIFQEYIPGEPGSAVFVGSHRDAQLLGITHQWSRRDVGGEGQRQGGFAYAGSLGPWELPTAAKQLVALAGKVLAERFSIRGLFGIDFVLCGGRPVFLEVNPRYTASVEILERVHGLHALALHAAAFANESRPHESPTPGPSPPVCGKAILYADRTIRFPFALADLGCQKSAPSEQALLADIPHLGTVIQAGHPILTVFAEGGDLAAVSSRLRKCLAELQHRIYRESGESRSAETKGRT